MKSRQLVFHLFLTTLAYGTGLSLRDPSLLMLYGLYYSACIFILKRFGYGEGYFYSFQESRRDLQGPKVIVVGTEVSSEAERDRQEDRYLNVFEPRTLMKRRAISWMLFGAGIWFFIYQRGILFSIPAILPLINCFIIIHSFYLGHLTLALLLNVLTVGISYSRELPPIFYFIYLVLFVATLALMSRARSDTHQFEKGGLKNLFMLSLGLFIAASALVALMPQDLSLLKSPDVAKSARSELQRALNRHEKSLTDLAQKLEQKRLESQQNLEYSRWKENLRKHQSELTELQKSLGGLNAEEILARFQQIQREGSLVSESAEKLIQGSSLTEFSPGEKELLQGNHETLDQATRDQLRSLVNRTHEELKQFPGAKTEELQAVVKDLQHKLETPTSGKELASELAKFQHLQQQLKLEEKSSVAAPHASELRTSHVQESLKDLDASLKTDKPSQDWKRIALGVGVLVLIGGLLWRWLKKKGVKREEGIDEVVLGELRDELKRLTRLKFAPREEVIHYYNFFHQSIQKIHYTDGETPPSCIVNEDLRVLNPEIKKSLFALTEIFALCFYGGREVDEARLKLFRQAFRNVVKVYQLK
jgi:hypothetical protein